MQVGSFTNLFMKVEWSSSTCFFIAIISLNLWYVINPPNAHGSNFMINKITMANNALHDLIMFQIHKLVIICL
jgi:hypothetical protein